MLQKLRRPEGTKVASLVAIVAGALVYLAVAPFRCEPDGACSGFVAFDYPIGSAAHLRALGAGAIVGLALFLPVWVAVSEPSPLRSALRAVLTVVLIGFIGVSLLSQHVLIVIGPVLGGILLWLMWRDRCA
jgi:apolipoprotein N-acyltransferase